jgi:hypothetical protein
MKPLNSTMATAPNAVGSRLPTPSWMPSPLAPPIPLWPDQRPENCRRMRTKIGTNPNTSSLNLHHLLIFNHHLVRRHPVPPPTPPHSTSSASIYNAAASRDTKVPSDGIELSLLPRRHLPLVDTSQLLLKPITSLVSLAIRRECTTLEIVSVPDPHSLSVGKREQQ